MKCYITEEQFTGTLLTLEANRKWRMKCESDGGKRTIIFEKHLYEIEHGDKYPCILYNLPMTLDVGVIQEDMDDGWENNIHEVWLDITEQCGFRPFE